MASLLDLAPSARTVTVRGVAVEVAGVTARGLAVVLRKHPQLIEALKGGGISVESLAEMGPAVVASVIAAGTGNPGDAKAEAVAESLSISDQLLLVEAIVSETFPDGPENFMKSLERVTGGALAGGEAA